MRDLNVEEYHYNNFTYKIDESKGWSIKKIGQVDPVSLFKYYSNSNFNIDAFIKNYFFLSHPYHLNDSLDCSDELIDFSGLKYNQYRSFYNVFLRKRIEESKLQEQYKIESVNKLLDMY